MIKYLLILIISTTNLLASEWCPDKIAVVPILFEKKVQPLFFVAESLLADFKYSYKVRSTNVFCLLSLQHKGINTKVELYPPIEMQEKLKIIFNKNIVSMEDIFLSKNVNLDKDVLRLLEKYKKIRSGEYWTIPIISGKSISWKKLTELSINDSFADRMNKIKQDYIDIFGWNYLYEYYFYIFMRLFIIAFLIVGFVFVKIKHSKNI